MLKRFVKTPPTDPLDYRNFNRKKRGFPLGLR